MKPLRREMRMIFQDPFSSLNPRFTVKDIIGEPLIIHNVAKGRELDERVGKLMKEVGLDPNYMNRYPHEFSGGQRQRIGLARTLSLSPRLIIADEPVSALDVSIQAQVLNLLKGLKDEFGLTLLFIAHDLSVVEHVSDRIAVMYVGKIVEMADTGELLHQPLHPYTEALLSSVPPADPDIKYARIPLQGEVPSPANPPKGCIFHPRCSYAKTFANTPPTLTPSSTTTRQAATLPRSFTSRVSKGSRMTELTGVDATPRKVTVPGGTGCWRFSPIYWGRSAGSSLTCSGARNRS